MMVRPAVRLRPIVGSEPVADVDDAGVAAEVDVGEVIRMRHTDRGAPRVFAWLIARLAVWVAVPAFASGALAGDFVTFESDIVRPLALSEDATRLYALNTPDGRLEIFDLSRGHLDPLASIPVGLEPVAEAVRPGSDEVWVVNHLSDSVSVVDVGADPPRVRRTLLVGDEPRDIVFAGPERARAFVTTAHRGAHSPYPTGEYEVPGIGRADVWVFDAAHATRPRTIVTLFGDRPRPLAVSPDGRVVYAGVFRSGNQTATVHQGFMCAGVPDGSSCAAPGGQIVPRGLPLPHANLAGRPSPGGPLIVQYVPELHEWRDELGRDWSEAVPFDLPDLDVFAIDAMSERPSTLEAWPGVGTVLYNMVTNPITGKLYVSNTQARNEVRFEGAGLFAALFKPPGEPASVRGHLHEARITVIDGDGVHPHHLNPHIDYDAAAPAPGTKQRSLSMPTAMAVSDDGRTLYMAAFGSSKIAVLDVAELEGGSLEPDADAHIEVDGGGPIGLVLDEARRRLYVLTRFDLAVAAIDLQTGLEAERVALHNPEPAAVVAGRPFLYDARKTSSNGEASCGVCHVFGDMDDLAWDLGDPDGDVVPNPSRPLLPGIGFPGPRVFHPMKGPMTTQSLRGMPNHGPLHWRGDRNGASADPPTDVKDVRAAFLAFNVAFEGLLGRVEGPLADSEMDAFADFALTLTYPPNPIRRLDGSLRPEEAIGREIFLERPGTFLPDDTCEACHRLDREAGHFGSGGDHGGSDPTKIPHLRNLYQKVGMFGLGAHPLMLQGPFGHSGDQIRGFGYTHSGGLDTVARQVGSLAFGLSEDDRRQLEAFMMAFDSELAPIVGQQVTIGGQASAQDLEQLALLVERAQAPFYWPTPSQGHECELVAHAGGQAWLLRGGRFEPALLVGDAVGLEALLAPGAERGPTTFTCVPPGAGRRRGLDRDRDGALDGDEARLGTDPADASSLPGACADGLDNDGDGLVDFGADPGCEGPASSDESPACSNGIDDDGDGRVDFPDDPTCAAPSGRLETRARAVRLELSPATAPRFRFFGWFLGRRAPPRLATLRVDIEGSNDARAIDRRSLRAGAPSDLVLPAPAGREPGIAVARSWLRDVDRDGAVELRVWLPSAYDHTPEVPICVIGRIEGDRFRACAGREHGSKRHPHRHAFRRGALR